MPGDTIDFHKFDKETLRRVERNDPDVRGLLISKEVDGIEGAGYIIGNNTTLRGISIHVDTDDGIAQCWYQELFRGLSNNRSIEVLQLVIHRDVVPTFDVFHILSPFFESNSSLRSFRVSGSNQIQSLASTLSKCNRETCMLQSVEIASCTNSDEDIASLLNSLKNIQTLLELDLNETSLGKNGSSALAELLQKSKIYKLELTGTVIEDEGIAILSIALTKDNNITSLVIEDNVYVTERGWYSLSRALAGTTSKMEKLCLSSTSINDEGVTILGEGLAVNRTLKCLHLTYSSFITATGWREFSQCLRTPHSVLEELDVSACYVDDDGAAAIVNAIVGGNSALKRMGMVNDEITPAGWMFVIDNLLNFAPLLEELVASADLDCFPEMDWTEDMDWTVLSRALCDSSNINRIFSSNHTFHSLEEETNYVLRTIPDEILTLMQMNKNERNKSEVARQKILKYHFAWGDKNIHEICCMPLAHMPVALGWIGRSNHGLSLMYNVVRELPILFDFCRGPQTKRQRF
jgi:hypothetical protein